MYTAQGVLLSEKSNWHTSFGKYENPCLVCEYYGHGFKDCPNILPEFMGSCLRCWSADHEVKNCTFQKRSIPFQKEYMTPEELKIMRRII